MVGAHPLLHAHTNPFLTLSAGATLLPLDSPQNLLSTTYTEAFLAQHLVAASAWHPYPRATERDRWQAMPPDLRRAMVARAEVVQTAGWKSLLASRLLEFKRTGNRSNYEADDFERRNHLQQLVLAECVEGQGRFIDDIVNGIWLICEESFWGVPAHLDAQRAGKGLPDVNEPIIDLFAADTVTLLAWTRYLLNEQLDSVSPLINKRIVLEAKRRILMPARERNDNWWMGFVTKPEYPVLNNWNPWINSNLLVANLLLEEDAKLRLGAVVRITKSLDVYLNKYSPDGACEEGPGYFGRAALSFFECVSTLESATGGRTSILVHPFIHAMGRYILNTHISGDCYVNYGDAHVDANPDGALIYCYGKAVHDKQLAAGGAWSAARRGLTATATEAGSSAAINASLPTLSRTLPTLLEADEIRSAPREEPLIRDVWYPHLGLMAAREKRNSAAGMFLAVQAASNGRSHSHNDSGSFMIYQDGDPVAIDVGVEAYSARTFGATRYSLWTMQSAFHNLPTIGGVMEHEGLEYQASQIRYESSDERAMLSFNLATAYPKDAGMASWIRTVSLDRKRGTVTIEENFELIRPVPISLSVLTPRTPIMINGAIRLQSKSAGSPSVLLKYDPTKLSPVVEKIPLTDAGLRSNWGEEIHRILLKSPQSEVTGRWIYEFAQESAD